MRETIGHYESHCRPELARSPMSAFGHLRETAERQTWARFWRIALADCGEKVGFARSRQIDRGWANSTRIAELVSACALASLRGVHSGG